MLSAKSLPWWIWTKNVQQFGHSKYATDRQMNTHDLHVRYSFFFLLPNETPNDETKKWNKDIMLSWIQIFLVIYYTTHTWRRASSILPSLYSDLLTIYLWRCLPAYWATLAPVNTEIQTFRHSWDFWWSEHWTVHRLVKKAINCNNYQVINSLWCNKPTFCFIISLRWKHPAS